MPFAYPESTCCADDVLASICELYSALEGDMTMGEIAYGLLTDLAHKGNATLVGGEKARWQKWSFPDKSALLLSFAKDEVSFQKLTTLN